LPHVSSRRALPAPAKHCVLCSAVGTLTIAELDEAWKDAHLFSWSCQRLALAVLDTHDEPLHPEDVVAFVTARTRRHLLTADSKRFKHSWSAVEIRADGRWAIAAQTRLLGTARTAVRERLAMCRRWASAQTDPAEVEARQRALERERAVHAGELAKLRRVIVHGWPASKPEAVVLLDVGTRVIHTFVGKELDAVPQQLNAYDVLLPSTCARSCAPSTTTPDRGACTDRCVCGGGF